MELTQLTGWPVIPRTNEAIFYFKSSYWYIFSTEKVYLNEVGNLPKVCYKTCPLKHLPPPGGFIIGGSPVEHDTPRNGPVPAGMIASKSSNFKRKARVTFKKKMW